MKYREINKSLSLGEIDTKGLLPHLELLQESSFIFRMDFGLDELPEEPGVILVRGARQYGKSTWIEQQVRHSIKKFGPGSAYYLNGDEIKNEEALIEAVLELLPLFDTRAPVHRLFIDEITAIGNWQKGMKHLLDVGDLRHVLVVTTGSKAADLRRGSERLPGRKGKLDRTQFLFTSLPYAEFKRVCGSRLGDRILPAYIISGGSPVACSELATRGCLPEYVIEMTRDWIYGEFAATTRSRASLLGVLECLHRFGGTPVGQAKLAREAGLSNNTIAAGYIELLKDLLCVSSAHPWDENRRKANKRRPCKFHMINLLAAVAWHPSRIRSIQDFVDLSPEEQGCLMEWTVAQEIWRRSAVRGDEMPEEMVFWQSKKNEIDFVVDNSSFIEVKRGKANPVDFSWFPQSFPKGFLTVINENSFSTDRVKGVTLEEFLLSS